MIDFNNAPLQSEPPQQRSGGGGDGRISAEDIRSRLNQDVRGFVLWLYSGRAFLYRTEARIGNLLGEPGTSLCIELTGNRTGQWFDHATDQGGDLISLYRGLMGYSGTSHFDRSLKEISADFFHDAVEIEQPSWRSVRTVMPAEKIAANKARWGDRPREEEEVLGPPIASYKYLDSDGKVIAGVTRYEPKTFRPWCFREIDGTRKWMIGSPQVRPLYHLPELADADEVVLVEGEGKADALAAFGVVTTSIMGGAGAVEKTNWLPLAMKRVCIWPDNDEAGEKFAAAAIAKLTSIGCKVWMVPIPAGRPLKWDCANCIADGEDPVVVLGTAIEVGTKPASHLYDYLDIRQIKARPDPVWLIDGMVNERSLGFIYGPPGSLKTFIALDMALCFVTGQRSWWGREIKREGAVVYLCREGVTSLKFRIMAWEQQHNVVADDGPFYLIEKGINFMKSEDIGTLLDTMKAIVNGIRGQPIAAVFVDTVSRVLPGARENQQDDMSLFVEACEAVQKTFDCVVFGVHHSNKAGGFRGSTVMPGAGDFLIETRREPGAMTGSIFAAKIKDGEDGWEQNFKVEKIALAEDRTSLIVAPVFNPSGGGGSGWPSREVCKEILAALHEQWTKGAPWCFAPNSSRAAAPNIMKRWNLKRDIVKDILQSWTACGVIDEDIRDTDKHIKGYRKLVDL